MNNENYYQPSDEIAKALKCVQRTNVASPLIVSINVIVWLSLTLFFLVGIYHFITNFLDWFVWFPHVVMPILGVLIYIEIPSLIVCILVLRKLRIQNPNKEALRWVKNNASILELSSGQIAAISQYLK
ncbi:hypothetical protein [Vibrio sp. 1F255]|uniref:hypothetical protein n=1 Tax=Vibrio sp. 1F255 TaxID=3230009 RepID=UPI00352F6887